MATSRRSVKRVLSGAGSLLQGLSEESRCPHLCLHLKSDVVYVTRQWKGTGRGVPASREYKRHMPPRFILHGRELVPKCGVQGWGGVESHSVTPFPAVTMHRASGTMRTLWVQSQLNQLCGRVCLRAPPCLRTCLSLCTRGACVCTFAHMCVGLLTFAFSRCRL